MSEYAANRQVARAICSVCSRSLPVRLDGMIRIHGPRQNRCPGSEQPPISKDTNQEVGILLSPQSSCVSSANSDDTQPHHLIAPGQSKQKILKRIPKGSRNRATSKLTAILRDISGDNSAVAWERLFLFPRRCLSCPKRNGRRWNLANLVNQAIDEEKEEKTIHAYGQKRTDPLKSLAARVSSKLEEGDFRGAVRLASSSTSIAPENSHTLQKLRVKHPPAHPSTTIPPVRTPAPEVALDISPSIVHKAIYSFPAGSAGGPDGLRPQHLKDIISSTRDVQESDFLSSLTLFVNQVVAGNVPPAARPFFFGTSLLGLTKEDGGVRPIAVGCTLRRLAAKCVTFLIKEEMGALLRPIQLGYGTSRGAEAAVHATRIYLSNLEANQVLFKLDYSNAFNTIRRDKMLLTVLSKVPGIYPLVHAAYSQPTHLYFDHIVSSSEGVQQGDPLGPLLFCLTIQDMISSLSSSYRVFYLDDGTLGGPVEEVLADLRYLVDTSRELGLVLNTKKSEIISKDNTAVSTMQTAFPSLSCVSPTNATLLGSPIGGLQSINALIATKIQTLQSLGARLKLLHAHDALCLLRHAFTMPKILYILRTAPCYQSHLLEKFDSIQRSLLETICNIHLTDTSWLQASLPINSGGLGIRGSTMLAPSAFLASAAGCAMILQSLLPCNLSILIQSTQQEALDVWRRFTTDAPPSNADASKQKSWDLPIVQSSFKSLLHGSDPKTTARLQAAKQKEAGAWLTAPPISAVGLRMDDEAIHVAVGLRLGTALCVPHSCKQCSLPVDESGTHGLSCVRSQGRIPRHAELNQLVQRALAAINIPSTLEPRGLSHSDDRRPDGLSMIPWSQGRALVWDVTVHDTFAPSYMHLSTARAGAVADNASSQKRRLYRDLTTTHFLVPLAFETSGVFAQDCVAFLRDLSQRSKLLNHDPHAYKSLCQRISVILQKYNCVCVLGTCEVH